MTRTGPTSAVHPCQLHGSRRWLDASFVSCCTPRPDHLAGFLVVLYFLQARMIFPAQRLKALPQAESRPARDQLVKLSTPRGETVAAALRPGAARRTGSPVPTLRRGRHSSTSTATRCASPTPSGIERFRRLGLNVLIPDYLGYGMSGGKPSERRMPGDGRGMP